VQDYPFNLFGIRWQRARSVNCEGAGVDRAIWVNTYPPPSRRLESGWQESEQLIAAYYSAGIAPEPAGG